MARTSGSVPGRYVPDQLIAVGDQLKLQWIDASALDLSLPFLVSSTKLALANGAKTRVTDIECLAPLAHDDLTEHLGLLFHLSHCGSTLARQACHRAEGAISIAEPPVLSQLLTSNALDIFDTHQRITLVRGALAAFCRAWPDHRVIIKLHSLATLQLEWFIQGLPHVPKAYLYRTPIEVLVSLARTPTRWMHSSAHKICKVTAIDPSFFEQRSADERATLVLHQGLARAIEHQEHLHLLSYQSMLEDRFASLFSHFGLDGLHDPVAQAVLGTDAKSVERSSFAPDSDTKRNEATSTQLTLARVLNDQYQQLETVRAQRIAAQ